MGECRHRGLSAIVAPVVTAVSCLRARGARRALAGLGLACAGAVLWTVLPPAVALPAMMLEPQTAMALLQAHGAGAAFAAGIAAWLLQLALERRVPHFGPTFEAATALAIVAAIRDDDRTLRRAESLYRETAVAPGYPTAVGVPDSAF